MWIFILTILLSDQCSGIYLIDIPNIETENTKTKENSDGSSEADSLKNVQNQFRALTLINVSKTQPKQPEENYAAKKRRFKIQRRRGYSSESIASSDDDYQIVFRQNDNKPQNSDEEKDEGIKLKIATLVQQALHDTERKIESIQQLKESHRDQRPYKIGFILSMIKKARDVLNELFNVAVKHREQWRALEQLKIFELIVHTNVDTTNLVRQLVEIHVQDMNFNTTRRMERLILL